MYMINVYLKIANHIIGDNFNINKQKIRIFLLGLLNTLFFVDTFL